MPAISFYKQGSVFGSRSRPSHNYDTSLQRGGRRKLYLNFTLVHKGQWSEISILRSMPKLAGSSPRSQTQSNFSSIGNQQDAAPECRFGAEMAFLVLRPRKLDRFTTCARFPRIQIAHNDRRHVRGIPAEIVHYRFELFELFINRILVSAWAE